MPITSSPFPNFGPRLKRLRRSAGIKQLALADRVGVDQATVSRWERGQQVPAEPMQRRVWAELSPPLWEDAALKRLVEHSADCVHLVDETAHICLAYSRARAADWQTSQRALLGMSLWRFATDEIQQAEAELAETGWWDDQNPEPRVLRTSERRDLIRIRAGYMRWERLYLSDGTPVRLVSGLRSPHI